MSVINPPDDAASRLAVDEGAWNPGITSHVPREVMALSTLYRPENAFRPLREAIEVAGGAGFPPEDFAVLRPSRLALHEVIIRVAAEFEIPDPEDADIGSLGINFRRMTGALVSAAGMPDEAVLNTVFAAAREEVRRAVDGEIRSLFAMAPSGRRAPSDSAWTRLRRRVGPSNKSDVATGDESVWMRDQRMVDQLTAAADGDDSDPRAIACRALIRVASAIRARHGCIPGRGELLAPLAVDIACSDLTAVRIGQLIELHLAAAADALGFLRLPAAASPVFMITKGASAAGKSTLRPLQRRLATRLGVPWSGFALVSPDIWRKALLDYGSLGPHYKYAGYLTSHEVALIDRKLDRYLVRKGERGLTSHMLIDRFRFDSFALDSLESRQLVSRFGKLLCYFFVITPPHATVERAWVRGLEVGRFKPVDDLLGHNVDAFKGMREILLGRALAPGASLHFELLDNGVPRGAVPLTVAFGWSGELNVLDVARMLDIERYTRIDVEARDAAAVYAGASMAAEANVAFLVECVRRFPRVSFADRASGRVYARFAGGRLAWMDRDAAAQAAADRDCAVALRACDPALVGGSRSVTAGGEFLDPVRFNTVGVWGRT